MGKTRFLSFGGAVPYRPVEDIAFAVARFFQRGGTFQNYYMVSNDISNFSYGYDCTIGLKHRLIKRNINLSNLFWLQTSSTMAELILVGHLVVPLLQQVMIMTLPLMNMVCVAFFYCYWWISTSWCHKLLLIHLNASPGRMFAVIVMLKGHLLILSQGNLDNPNGAT